MSPIFLSSETIRFPVVVMHCFIVYKLLVLVDIRSRFQTAPMVLPYFFDEFLF